MASKRLPYVLRLLATSSIVLLLSGAGHLLNHTPTSPGVGKSTIEKLVDDSMRPSDLPNGFDTAMGYVPSQESGSWEKPRGDCSFPVRIHPETFEAACRKHDLGYDLLRFAAQNGHRTDPVLRYSIDHRFHQDLVEACADTACRILAHLYGLGVTLNSIRQGYGPPTTEPLFPWMLVWGTAMAVAFRRPIRVRQRSPVGMGASGMPAVR